MSAGRGENASFQSSQRRAAACILKIYPKAGMPACGKRRVLCLYRELFFGCPFCPCRNFMENTPFPRGQKICPTYFELCQTYFCPFQTAGKKRCTAGWKNGAVVFIFRYGGMRPVRCLVCPHWPCVPPRMRLRSCAPRGPGFRRRPLSCALWCRPRLCLLCICPARGCRSGMAGPCRCFPLPFPRCRICVCALRCLLCR